MSKYKYPQTLEAIKLWLQERPSKGIDKIKSVRPLPPSKNSTHPNSCTTIVLRGPDRHWNLYIEELDGFLKCDGYFIKMYELADPECLTDLEKDSKCIYKVELEEI